MLNYEIVGAHVDAIDALGPRALIIDESHYVKSPKAQRTRAVLRLADRLGPTALRLALTEHQSSTGPRSSPRNCAHSADCRNTGRRAASSTDTRPAAPDVACTSVCVAPATCAGPRPTYYRNCRPSAEPS